jgi:hypothetical protein
MKVKYARLGVLLVLVLAAGTTSEAVSTRDIDAVREKGVLDSADLLIIDGFVSEGVQELLSTTDFTSIANVRAAILSRGSSTTGSAAAQYTEQFSESAYKYVSEGLKTAEGLKPAARKVKVIINLLILVDGLANPRLADLALGMLNNENSAIRYWAIHCVTSPGITKRLNSAGGDSKSAERITEELKKVVEKASPESLELMARFAADVKIGQGEELLLQIADMRISRYANWNVDNAVLDAEILKLLSGKVLSAKSDKPAVAQRFGQLYSYAIQRYIRGGDNLSAAEKNQLVSVLVETEQSCIGKLLDMPQSIVQKAIEQSDLKSLLAEHNRLLGDETGAGKLALKLNFDYGKAPDGEKRIAPLALPEPPKAEGAR